MSESRGFRAWANQHGAILVACAITVAVLAIIWSRWSLAKPVFAAPTQVFFVDEITGDIVVEPAETIPPIAGSDGKPTLVRGCFYTLGSDAEKQLAYLEKYTDASKAAAATQTAYDPASAPPEVLVRAPEPGSLWVRADSPAGEKVIARMTDAVGKPGFRTVFPKP